MSTKESLLDKALRVKDPYGPSKPPEHGMVEEVELAMAYHERSIYAPAVAEVLGIKSSAVSSWFASVVMKGIRHGILKVVWNDEGLSK